MRVGARAGVQDREGYSQEDRVRMARIAVDISRLVLSLGLDLPRQQSAALEGRHMVSALEEVRGGGVVVAVARIAIVSLCSLMDSA